MFDLVNLLDIFIIAALIYSLYMWLKGTRAYHILIGLGILGILYSIANWSGLLLTSQILQYLLGVTLLLIIVVFQPEIRQLLERVSPLVIFRLQSSPISRRILKEITEACFELSEKRIGGPAGLPRATGISGVVQHGVKLDSLVSQELVVSIFHPSSPIHDGAIIVEKDRVVEAATYLPLSTREHLPPRYGTRHRAALGVSELGDTFCVRGIRRERRGIRRVRRGHLGHGGPGEALADARKVSAAHRDPPKQAVDSGSDEEDRRPSAGIPVQSLQPYRQTGIHRCSVPALVLSDRAAAVRDRHNRRARIPEHPGQYRVDRRFDQRGKRPRAGTPGEHFDADGGPGPRYGRPGRHGTRDAHHAANGRERGVALRRGRHFDRSEKPDHKIRPYRKPADHDRL